MNQITVRFSCCCVEGPAGVGDMEGESGSQAAGEQGQRKRIRKKKRVIETDIDKINIANVERMHEVCLYQSIKNRGTCQKCLKTHQPAVVTEHIHIEELWSTQQSKVVCWNHLCPQRVRSAVIISFFTNCAQLPDALASNTTHYVKCVTKATKDNSLFYCALHSNSSFWCCRLIPCCRSCPRKATLALEVCYWPPFAVRMMIARSCWTVTVLLYPQLIGENMTASSLIMVCYRWSPRWLMGRKPGIGPVRGVSH